MAFGVRKLPAGAAITTDLVGSLAKATTLPDAMERIDNLVLHLASTVAPGQRTDLHAAFMCATLGTATAEESQWVISQAERLQLVSGSAPKSYGDGASVLREATLTIEGWRRHAELMREGAGSRHAFMAMKFGDPELTSIYRDQMRPAVEQAGFDLRAMNEDHKTAGSIDNRMRVEIRTSRFVVCDLTHGNRGAYWEAGFAEGLGRPVFYTCRSDVLQDRQHVDHPHFDTAHQLIIAWNPADPSPAMQELKDVIRATLPAEARMEDR